MEKTICLSFLFLSLKTKGIRTRFNSVVCTDMTASLLLHHHQTDRRQSCSLLSCCLHQPFEYRTTEKIHHRKNPDYCCSLDIFLFFRLVPEWDACVWKSQYILISEIFRPTCSSVTTCFIQNHLNDLSFSFWCSVWTSAGHIGLNTLSYCHVISSWSFSHKKEREKKRKFRWESPQKRRH